MHGQRTVSVGVDDFGESGTIEELYAKYGLLPEQIVNFALVASSLQSGVGDGQRVSQAGYDRSSMTVNHLHEDPGTDEGRLLAWVFENVPIEETSIGFLAREMDWPERRVWAALQELCRNGITATARRLGCSDRKVMNQAAVFVGSFAPVVFPLA